MPSQQAVRMIAEPFSHAACHLSGYALKRWPDSKTRMLLLALSLILAAGGPLAARAGDPASDSRTTPTETDEVSFAADVQPIFARHCYGCHQANRPLGDYVMTNIDRLMAGGETGEAAIVPGDPGASYLMQQIQVVDGHAEMPDEPNPTLSPTEIETIGRWIAAGAKNDSIAPSITYDSEHPPAYARPPAVATIDVSSDGRLMAVAGHHEIVLVNVDDGRIVDRLIGMSPRINELAFSPEDDFIAAAAGTPGQSGELQVWRVSTAELVASIAITYDALSGLAWSPDGKTIAVGCKDNSLRAYDWSTGQQTLFQGAHEDWVLGTTFTNDGKHLVSVARDMTCKLTEVATERFIDNITSITPGALSGGLSDVVVHPGRDEIVVGGADGSVKVYRVFRQTKRRIGDDANLVRSLEPMDGRIHDLDVSSDGAFIVAAATIDGHSQVRVWKYDFDGTLSDQLKAIMAKRVTDRSEKEKQTLREHRDAPVSVVGSVAIPDAAVYSVTFAGKNRVVIATNDGRVSVYSADADKDGTLRLVATHRPFAVGAERLASMRRVDPREWAESVSSDDGQASAEIESSFATIEVLPESIEMAGPYDYAQLIVTGKRADGTTIDLTRHAKFEVPEFLIQDRSGLVRVAEPGQGVVGVRVDDHVVEVPTIVRFESESVAGGSVDYVRDIAPVLTRLGCNQGTCHGAQKGKNGFKLSLRGYDPVFDLRALSDDLAGRRIDAAAPDDSLMLRKPLGQTPHQGGVLMDVGDRHHTMLRRWIADGATVDLASAKVVSIDIQPQNPILSDAGEVQQFRIEASYADGRRRDVTRHAFIDSGDTEVATTDDRGGATAVRRGEAAVLARYEGAYVATTLTVMGDRTGYVDQPVEYWNDVDRHVAEKWRRVKVAPSPLADDATFLRRVHLDLTGLPPSSDAVRAFLDDPTPTRIKRARLVDDLIGNEDYVVYWTNRWADLLQVNRKFLGVEGATKFRDWIADSVAEGKPYDQFAREILTATGSNREVPAASYYKVLRDPESLVENTTHLFLGIRFNCNKCHDHPFERWTQDQYYETAAYFAQVGLSKDPESGSARVAGTAVEGAKPLYEFVQDGSSGEIQHPRTGDDVAPSFPYEVPVEHPGQSRRESLAEWIVDADNPYFARSFVNRLWASLLGVGLIEPVDDIRAGNPPSNPELLDYLTDEFIQSGFDTRHILRLICNSRTYQLSSETSPMNEDDRVNYSHAYPRRLPAEVIYDAVHQATGSVSEIPGMPPGTRAAAMTDSGVKLQDNFLQNLGRPVRESACACERSSELQLGPIMALVSGPTIGSAIADPKNALDEIVSRLPDNRAMAEEIFLRLLGRRPSDAEFEAFEGTMARIDDDHDALVNRLRKAEQAWETTLAERERTRKSQLDETKAELKSREDAIAEERAKMAADREARIAAAKKAVSELEDRLPEIAEKRLDAFESVVTWVPVSPARLTTTNKATLEYRSDRSVVATASQDAATKAKGVYTIEFDSPLERLTAVRLEALADDDLPAAGPGLAANGNFVLTELTLASRDATTDKADSKATKTAKKQASWSNIVFSDAVADFTQGGFAAKQLLDGQTRNQGGWAIAGGDGADHWTTLTIKNPESTEGKRRFRIELHQFHNAEHHRLGRFRISVTGDSGPVGLDSAELIAAAKKNAVAGKIADWIRGPQWKTLVRHIRQTDEAFKKANAALASAQAPLPPDDEVVRLQKRIERLSVETPIDPKLVRLRSDVEHSQRQRRSSRLTAAEDLVWALVNSPAFLFNH